MSILKLFDLAVELSYLNDRTFHMVPNQTISDISLAEVSTDSSSRSPLIWSGSYSQVCIHESRGKKSHNREKAIMTELMNGIGQHWKQIRLTRAQDSKLNCVPASTSCRGC